MLVCGVDPATDPEITCKLDASNYLRHTEMNNTNHPILLSHLDFRALPTTEDSGP